MAGVFSTYWKTETDTRPWSGVREEGRKPGLAIKFHFQWNDLIQAQSMAFPQRRSMI
jgi:hypothetical protein